MSDYWADGGHHAAVRVADIERSAQFYIDAFGGEAGTSVFVLDGPWAEQLFGADPGLSAKGQFINFRRGGVVLFQFVDPSVATARRPAWESNVMHFAIQVSNVEEAASRVVAAGGTTMFPVAPYGSKGSVSYCVDPDGNVMDVLDLDWAQTVIATLENFTDATPSSS